MNSDPGRVEHVEVVREIVESWMLIASTSGIHFSVVTDDGWFQENYESFADKKQFLDTSLVHKAASHPHSEDWLEATHSLLRHQLFYALLAQSSEEIVEMFVNKVVENTYDDHRSHDCVGDTRILLGLIKIPAGRIQRKKLERQRKSNARGASYPMHEFAIA